MSASKEKILADLKGIHITVTDLINELGGNAKESELSKQGMNDAMQDYLSDIAMLIEDNRLGEALKMARQGAKFDWRRG